MITSDVSLLFFDNDIEVYQWRKCFKKRFGCENRKLATVEDAVSIFALKKIFLKVRRVTFRRCR
jgi:hypothetical protein